MRRKQIKRETFEELDRQAHDFSDFRPLSEKSRQAWEAAKRTGARLSKGRPKKDPSLKSRIVPISMTPALLEKVDKYTKTVGITRSGLIAEALEMRLLQPPVKNKRRKAG